MKNKQPVYFRFFDIILRSLHMVFLSIILGGTFFNISHEKLVSWIILLFISGLLLIALELLHNRHWFHQGRAFMVFLHIGFFELARIFPNLIIPLIIAAVFTGMMGSHMPRKYRYYSFFYKRMM